ncbi:MAG: hypothetical protein DCC65_00760 [Planctomycetota bacterium]|nr:MAG: hypothetical protein DCC65_00760 [Planctomycetota bacterium]
MKIALVIERFEPWRGGAETSTQEIARLLAARGHEVHVVTTTNAAPPPDLTMHRIPGGTLLRPLRMAAFIRRSTEFLKARSFDIVHAISPLGTGDTYQPRGGLLGETLERNVATRSSRPRQLLKQALLAMNMKQRSLLDLERHVFREGGPTILAVSNYVARQCERIYGVSSPRVRVVFNGVSVPRVPEGQRQEHRLDIRRQHQVPDGQLLLLFVAHNFRLKGLSPLIETISRLVVSGFESFHLLVVGRDNPIGYQRRLQELGIARFVTFTGPTQRTLNYLHAADVLVHPTYYDPCSRVVLEGLSAGLPCITTAFNGAAEVITDGHDGFVIESPDAVGMWARRIQELSDGDLRRRMSQRALELRERVGMQRHVDELELVFKELVETRSARSQPV